MCRKGASHSNKTNKTNYFYGEAKLKMQMNNFNQIWAQNERQRIKTNMTGKGRIKLDRQTEENCIFTRIYSNWNDCNMLFKLLSNSPTARPIVTIYLIIHKMIFSIFRTKKIKDKHISGSIWYGEWLNHIISFDIHFNVQCELRNVALFQFSKASFQGNRFTSWFSQLFHINRIKYA